MTDSNTTAREILVVRLKAADFSWDQIVLVDLAHSAADDIERLMEIIKGQKEWPAIPQYWHVASIAVRRDPGWCFGGALTYDALLERDGGDHEARGVGSDPVSAVVDAMREIVNG